VKRLSALRTGQLYSPGNIPGNNFLLEAELTIRSYSLEFLTEMLNGPKMVLKKGRIEGVQV